MIDNYKLLLIAILNSDSGKVIMNKVIGVYDVEDNNRLVAIFSKSKYCAKFFETTERAINCNISTKSLRNNKFSIERIDMNERNT